VIFGYDPTTKTLLGMKVLESKETPGLGDRIEKDTVWVAQFVGVESPLEPVRTGRGTGKPTEVDLITGATISSRTIVRIINEALERLGPALESRGGTPP
jgi:electron transport complex protein RnfG